MVIFCYHSCMTLLNVNQTLFVIFLILGIAVVIILLALLAFLFIYRSRHVKELTYLKLNKIAQENDYLLLNNYRIHIDDNHVANIDHILITDKFIVIINDFKISGVISGDYNDDELRNINKNKQNQIINPLNLNINLAKRLALFNDLSFDLIKGLAVVNSDSVINITNNFDQFKIVRLKDLTKEIKRIDSINVKKLKEDNIVRFINYLNENNNK